MELKDKSYKTYIKQIVKWQKSFILYQYLLKMEMYFFYNENAKIGRIDKYS